MKSLEKTRRLIGSKAGIVLVFAILGCAILLLALLIRGRGFGLWRLAHLGRALLDSATVSGDSEGRFTNVVFLHHSTGANLIEQGGVREVFQAAGYDFWDHGYNSTGLRRPDGSFASYSYRIPDDNTDPDGLARLFDQRTYGLPWNAFSGLLQHEVIAVKSCFPTSQIDSDEQLSQYKAWYLAMRDVMDTHPDKLFVVISPPPLNPAATDAAAAARARAFAEWLNSDEYLSGHSNVATFDFFDSLAEDDPALPDYNMLRAAYRDGSDSHPNQVANEIVGPQFSQFVIEAADKYRTVYSPQNRGE